MIVNRNDYLAEYSLFLVNEAYEHEKMVSIINSTLLSESVDKVDYITESVLESLKTFIDKIVQSISDAWNKFTTNAKAFFDANDKYLTKYEKIILENKVAKANIKDFYNYDLDKLKSFNIPDFDYNKLSTIITDKEDESRDAFIKTYFNEFIKDDKLAFSNNVKNVFHGGDMVDINASDLKMKDIYAYVKDYKTVLMVSINKDIDKLKEANTKAYAIINKMKGKVVSNTKVANESFDFKSTIDYYFGEATIEEEPEPKEEKETKDDTTKDNTTDDSTTNKSSTETPDTDEFKKDEKVTKIYFNICSEFLSAKLSVAQEAYKTYIKIIKWHVKHYVKDTTEEKPETVETKVEDKPSNSEDNSAASNNEKLDNAGK